MALVIAVVLSLVVIAYIGYPFYQSRQKRISFEVNHRAEELDTRKSEIYSAIKDIEFDYQMGKLSEEDYQELRGQYRAQAVALLKEIDEVQGVPTSKKSKSSNIKFCSQCGTPVSKGDQFCAECGADLA
ncbi:MAG: zinc-ribbon domain-containing protein [Deferribacteres bacterium]|nr:zinc-ribbon domain-containing protein [candidate division KSB1 bacterium]MCB9510168.1 zinc-ribbon domain-containing protein [Deferribacteres bacterium]